MSPLLLKNYDLMLFDLDDTLFDHSAAFKRGVYETIRQFPILKELDQFEFLRTFSNHHHRLWPRFSSNELNFQQFSTMRMENTLADFNVSATPWVLRQIVKTFQAAYVHSIKPDTVVNRFLSHLKKKVRIGIVTNGTAFNAYEKVERLELSDIFPESSVIISERVGFSKPHVGIFQHVLDVFNSEAARTLFIGDNYFTDILGAHSIGMDTLWINKYDRESPGEIHPAYMIKHVLDLEELIIRGERKTSDDKTISN
ncbi:HAD family hydrolase [Rossellomorea sp. SC111]|uniref:HAD family hydrolase n=1 Tax=Rossellomorea sp. SC111 TaxID=2968985 RepID=UPI00215A7105|nr:HAD family hydrolase [Rossellomorea sp. SC111]MCR8847425.1 HAD family hydrolase [Rossellomorea sp. SC111]